MQMPGEIQVRLRRSHFTIEQEEEDRDADAERDQGKVEEVLHHSIGGEDNDGADAAKDQANVEEENRRESLGHQK